MDGLAAGGDAGRDDRGDPQVALRGRRRADADGLVGEPHVGGVGVGGRVDGDGLGPELVDRPDDANGDLAAIRHEDPPEHC